MDNKKQLMVMVLCGMASIAQAGEKEELLKLRNTTTNLIKELVKQGVLSEKAAEDMIKRAEADAEAQVAQQANEAGQNEIAPEPGEVRVPYVPEFVKDEIRQQVRTELRADVVKDVMQEAKTQKWGVPDALPEWISRFKLSGDLRLRSQNDFMADDNISGPNVYSEYPNIQAINQAGGLNKVGELHRGVNTENDRHRFRERLRISLDAKVADGLNAGVRLITSNLIDPVSTNQTLGNSSGQYQFNIDRAFLKYDAVNNKGFKWLTVSGGRIANPWYVGGGEFTGGSELVWDTDLSFEGFAVTARHSLDSYNKNTRDISKSAPHSVFITAGAFPLQESALSSKDKWLFGSQIGLDWGFDNHDALKMGVAYYDYENIKAKPNTSSASQFVCSTNNAENSLSVPQFMQLGNTLALICNEDATTPGQYGLAGDYKIVNVSGSYDLSIFAPHHLILGADYAKNVGFSVNDAEKTRFLTPGTRPISDETQAWQVRVDFGWPKVSHAGEWSVFTFYKYVERDAVLDANTDSDFHLGGTNAKGWVLGANYGLMKNVWATGRWLSTDVISGPKYSNDVLQLDLNTSF
ncbi:MAG: putative porin [Methylovulum sp.]|uniref:putative porin n=1 Tax=Methylovulum sp. TaxID=1916980 RepID=UPI0026136F9C|nr:putative porin [Methylovulum sp.]MDD2722746.1 putative porin [Methylovulum sp.]MDD5125005.1 putative porin [Methylovulum sp.]